MILVQPQYFPTVNFFKKFENNKIFIDYNSDYSQFLNINKTRIVNLSNTFEMEVPLVFNSKDIKIKELKIDHNRNWINSHIQSIQSSYGKFPYYTYYIDDIIKVLKLRHNFLIDLNYDLLTLLYKFLNFEKKIQKFQNKYNLEDIIKVYNHYNSNIEKDNIEEERNNLFLGKKFDYSYSVIDLIFLKGPESGYFIRNFKEKN
tara:strand:+ start:3712 stop:4317 length:606 start_codon:yes stop_codon:yes gene_type:complete